MRVAEAFLESVVPKIEKSPAYRADGMIAITFDQAPQTGDTVDSTSCCGQPTYANLAMSGAPADGSPTSEDGASTDTTAATTTTGTATTAPPTTTGTATTAPPTTSGTATTAPPTTTGTAPPTTTGTESTPSQNAPAGQPKGGGIVGLLLISKYVKPGTINGFDLYNHFSLMASLEDLFGLDRIGYAAASGLPVFGDSVYTRYSR